MKPLLLGLYIHIPFCLKKCPYCDFNSYGNSKISEHDYIAVLLRDLVMDVARFDCKRRELRSIFIGGGTPSLFTAASIAKVLEQAARELSFSPDIEITIEANPGTLDLQKCRDYRAIGINRISLGVQSFNDRHLRALGRIHDARTAQLAIQAVIDAGFENFNLDLMFGLPEQKLDDIAKDLLCAVSWQPAHISWYQLTLEPNTPFALVPPSLPSADTVARMSVIGKDVLAAHNFAQYEISAYSRAINYQCQHNLNYWQFGDYLGIGCGAHGKITVPNAANAQLSQIIRYAKQNIPEDYMLAGSALIAEQSIIATTALPFEFMLNILRLYQKIPLSLFEQRTFLHKSAIIATLAKAEKLGLIMFDDEFITTTKKGKDFLNDLLELFL